MIADFHEQLDPDDVQDPELGGVQSIPEATRIVIDPLTVRVLRSNVPRGWFDPEMTWEAEASGRRGRQQTYSDAASQACLTLKVLFGLPLRQTTGFVDSLLKRVGLEWSVPDFSTLCRRQRTLSVAIPYKGSAGPLHLLIDSTGIKAEGEGEWNARKHGGSKRRLWRKLHIGVDEETLEIRAIEVTSSSIGPSRQICYTNRLPGNGRTDVARPAQPDTAR